MLFTELQDRLLFLLNRIREKLWVKPLLVCLLSIVGVFAASLVGSSELAQIVPTITEDSIETLLTVLASSMLVIAIFAVGAMVSAYASASSTATPRSFPVVLRDDISQNALSAFVGSFIFSVVALIAVKNGYYSVAGHFTLFIETLLVFGIVILVFVRWVDRIARLGRLGTTIDKVEEVTAKALERRRQAPALHGVPMEEKSFEGTPVFADSVGHVQNINISALQEWATTKETHIMVAALPGSFITPDRPLAYVRSEAGDTDDTAITQAFGIGDDRLFDQDPRFGLVVLSEIASRALSPAVNDPGTAIDVVGTLIRLFVQWSRPLEKESLEPKYDRVIVPEISLHDMFDDAFRPIARDGAGIVEVNIKLQKALQSLATTGNEDMAKAARRHSQQALKRALKALPIKEDWTAVRKAAGFEK